MKYKLIIDVLDNNQITKDISNELYNRLMANNLDVLLLDNSLSTKEKINEINSYGENTIVISNQMNNANTSEIIYSLYYDNVLPILIDNQLKDILNVAKFYQLRSPADTSQDYYEIIRETPLAESIIIRYQNINNNLIDQIVEALSQAINNYILKENIYIVQKGDTIYAIARRFNVSVADILKINNLANANLSIGQELIIPEIEEKENDEIPEQPFPSQTYVVVSGDSLYKIANKFNTTVSELKELNGLTTNNLSIGQILKLPNQINENYQTYTVVSGDSLYKIANKFNTTVSELISLNNLTSTNLSIGQTLLIPSSTTSNQTYTVVSGDSLYKIANKFNTTVSELISLNNLTSTNLSIGQTLLIPI